MPTILVTGVNRGIGLGFLRLLSEDPNNTVIGTVRDKNSVKDKIVSEVGDRPNIHLVNLELLSYESIKKSVEEVSAITNGSLDYIIANAGYISDYSALDPIGVLAENPQGLDDDLIKSFKINVVGNIHLFNLYMPLILKGSAKKVIAITSGMADNDLVNKYKVGVAAPYSISKSALNMALAKFNAQYADDGVLFMGICPSMVETGHYDGITEEQQQKLMKMVSSFQEYAPGSKQVTPHESVSTIWPLVQRVSVENGDGGSFVSRFGNKQWL